VDTFISAEHNEERILPMFDIFHIHNFRALTGNIFNGVKRYDEQTVCSGR
jgi:hypothetical protein